MPANDANNDGDYDDDNDVHPDDAVTGEAGDRVRIRSTDWVMPMSETDIYYYDEEAIEINPSGDIELKLKSNQLDVTADTPLREPISGQPTSAYELKRSVTLICEASADGTIIVADFTPRSDYPEGSAEYIRRGSSHRKS